MKKLLALILAVICCLGMVACGAEKVDNTKTLDDAIAILNNLYKDTVRTPADYDLVGSVKVGEKTVEVIWTVSIDTVKVVASEKAGFFTVDVPDMNETETTYVLKATVKVGKDTKAKEFNITLPVIVFDPYESEPAENTAYKLILIQGNLGKNLFATHEISGGKYYATTEDAAAAPDFFAEKVEGGYKFYTMIEGAKSYVLGYLEGTSKRLKYDADGSVWYYKEDCKCWFTKINGGEYYLGTYNTFNTLCISDGTYMKPDNTGVSQFPANLITLENVNKLAPSEEVVIYNTVAEIYAEAAKLENNQLLSGGHNYTLTGVITSIDTEYSADYGNVTVTIEVEGKAFQCFRLKGEGADTIKVGDNITVEGPISIYNEKIQVNQGTLKSVN